MARRGAGRQAFKNDGALDSARDRIKKRILNHDTAICGRFRFNAANVKVAGYESPRTADGRRAALEASEARAYPWQGPVSPGPAAS